jgi:hypothetical protein
LDECNFIRYRTEIIAHKTPLSESSHTSIHFDFDFMIEFKFKDIDVFPQRRYHQMTFSDFLAQSGGVVGLFAGISALSIIELFYFMTLRWMVNLQRWIRNR